MIKLLGRNIIRFIFLVLLQVLILDRIQIAGGQMGTPFLFILFIIILPFETPGWFLLILAFFLGLSVDIFNDTAGIHAASTVFMTFARPLLLQLLAPRDGYEAGTYPRLYYYGLGWFIKYSLIMIVLHHTAYFVIEAFSFQNFHFTVVKILMSTLYSLILIVLSQFLMYRKA
jgi:rod shape-determining protein MreD